MGAVPVGDSAGGAPASAALTEAVCGGMLAPGWAAAVGLPAPGWAGTVGAGAADASADLAAGTDGAGAGGSEAAGTSGMNTAYPRVPGGMLTGIAQAGAPSAPGHTIGGGAPSVGGMTSRYGVAFPGSSLVPPGVSPVPGGPGTGGGWVKEPLLDRTVGTLYGRLRPAAAPYAP
ncbi:hypothetical protein AB0B71_24155 [Micromonospora echinofusca]|uniref:hypothetical protein n=1 Tax=Micromonospora echinofusca TaxID=47858 RepID=UPI0033D0089D